MNANMHEHNQMYKQLSIYDFLPEEKSQELPPSETVAQMDEAQESEKLPSSALDTKESTEDTDSTLFSVGDVLTVKSPDEVYSMDTHPEDYYHLHEHQGKKVVITSRRKAYRGVFYGTSIEENGKVPFFYHRELKI
ncbi:hypothetical protein OCB39_25585 [Bacillus cereus]|nr:hypothetical protein [Bacillus cereus]